MQARLEDAVRKCAQIPAGACALLVVGAVGSHVRILQGVSTCRFLSLVSKWARTPVVRVVLQAGSHLVEKGCPGQSCTGVGVGGGEGKTIRRAISCCRAVKSGLLPCRCTCKNDQYPCQALPQRRPFGKPAEGDCCEIQFVLARRQRYGARTRALAVPATELVRKQKVPFPQHRETLEYCLDDSTHLFLAGRLWRRGAELAGLCDLLAQGSRCIDSAG